MGLEERLVYSPIDDLRLTLGGEYQYNLTARQYGVSATGPAYLDCDDPFATEAVYLVGDYAPSKLVKLSLGARYDNYNYSSNYDHCSRPRSSTPCCLPTRGPRLSCIRSSATSSS